MYFHTICLFTPLSFNSYSIQCTVVGPTDTVPRALNYATLTELAKLAQDTTAQRRHQCIPEFLTVYWDERHNKLTDAVECSVLGWMENLRDGKYPSWLHRQWGQIVTSDIISESLNHLSDSSGLATNQQRLFSATVQYRGWSEAKHEIGFSTIGNRSYQFRD